MILRSSILFSLLALFVFSTSNQALCFGDKGVARFDEFGDFYLGDDLVLLEDGNRYFVFATKGGDAETRKFAMVAINQDGQLDLTFNETGWKTFDLGSKDSLYHYKTIQLQDGSYFSSVSRAPQRFILHLDRNGKLLKQIPMDHLVVDLSQFPSGQIVGLMEKRGGDSARTLLYFQMTKDGSIEGTYPLAKADYGFYIPQMALLDDNSFYLALFHERGNEIQLRLSDGSLDASFANDGIFESPTGEGIESIAVGPDGRLFAATMDGWDSVIFALTREGILDREFGMIYPWSVERLFISPTYQIIARNVPSELTAFNNDGKIDRHFGKSGVVYLPQRFEKAMHTILFDVQNRLVTAGLSDRKLRVARFKQNGELDID